ncbi:MAG: LacI family DNA-binding transcriptional regulator [Clostridia bacterium]|nr:LacI family DNA-binding transcriptional regulator [Clostridia bacterium]
MAKSPSARVTTADIAREVGVSQTTVSLVLNRKNRVGISKATSDSILKAAIKLGYLQPGANSALSCDNRRDVAVIVPDIINPSFTRFLAQVSDYAYQNQVGLFLCNVNRSPDIERGFISQMIDRDINGILYIFTPTCTDLLDKIKSKIPIVIVGDSTQSDAYANIATDNYMGAQLLAEHLFNLGHRSVAYITPPINAVSVLRERRMLGLKDYFSRRGCADSFYVLEQTSAIPPSSTTALEVTIGQTNCLKALDEHPDVTAIVTQGDLIAIGVYQALANLGKRIPEDISVASFDDIEYGRYITPPLTSIDTKLNLRCKHAFDYLLQLIVEGVGDLSDTLYVSYKSSLVQRGSTAQAPRVASA